MIKNNESQYTKLRKWNIGAGSLHFLSLVAVLILANNFALPVTATYMTGAPGTTSTGPIVLFSVKVAYTIALFLGLSSFFHFLISTSKFFPRYINGLKNKRNIFRWVEYSFSSTVMILTHLHFRPDPS